MFAADWKSQSQSSIFKEGTLVLMEPEEECKVPPKVEVHDVEEGEISDSASSVEEITEADFIKQDAVVSSSSPVAAAAATTNCTKSINVNSENNNNSNVNNNNNTNGNNQKQRVWTMRDLYNYQMSRRNFSSNGLYSLAWASGVQNKPLDEVIVMEFPTTTAGESKDLKRVGSYNYANGVCESKDDKVVIEVDDEVKLEKEEGELEEGEIDLDSEVVDSDGNLGKEADLERRVDFIRKGLESVTVENVQKSFSEVCSGVQNLVGSIKELAVENSLIKKDDLIQLCFAAVRTVNTVFCSMNQYRKDQTRESIKRFFTGLTSQFHALFCAEQLKEIEVMVSSLDSVSSSKASDRDKEMQDIEGFAKNDFGTSSENVNLDFITVNPSDQTESRTSLEYSKFGLSNPEYRGLSLPLLDLHKDHDADSLPSPTREAPSGLPIDKGFVIGRGVLKPEWPVPRVALETDNVPMHPYETDALKAVSSYQQKFGQSSFLMTDRLPSPTPSEDGDTGDGDINGEVSSSPNKNANPAGLLAVGQPVVSSAPKMENLSGQALNNVWNVASLSSGPHPLIKASSGKSRDPRLRAASSDATAQDCLSSNEIKVEPVGGMMGIRKHKPLEEPVLDGPALKKQRNELTESGILNDVKSVTGTGGLLEDRGTAVSQTGRKPELVNDPRKPGDAVNVASSISITPSVAVKRNENLPVVPPSATSSLQSLLKDIAVNPSIWMNIIKTEQQKSTDPTKSTAQPPMSNSILKAVPLTNVATPKPSVLGQGSPGILQTPPQTASMEELGAIRMKPRDPRRVLHSNTPQKVGNMEVDQSQTKISTLSTSDIIGDLDGQRQDDQLDTKSSPSHSITPPDITRLFTTNLKNIADLISVSQGTPSQSAPTQMPSLQPTQALPGRIDSKVVGLGFHQTGTGLASKDVSTLSSRPQSNWGDVEHLFEGFDDQQKAAIQRERARRLEEQRKMFAARKLCLVLDLDHTLLNSAKFAEVDPLHDEILRKKEELDREKPYRHLFRFPHMAMWTKLRPGIWNFLEKASKLFELHLYTMGNKLYATEMAKLLDPKGDLFAGRVISRGDDSDLFDGDERVPKSKDLEGVLGMESAVVIIDDSVRVWPHNKLNLIVVERYIYFPCSRRQFGLPGPSLLEINHDERTEDGTLASSLAVIERIHQSFFGHQSLDEADVRNILASEQRKILAGCRIMFSRVFPVGEAHPHLHPLWQTAEQFGAVCTNSIDEQVTHVVANSLGTDKVNWALSRGRFVVHPGWVEASALLYRRANEHDFAIKP